MTATSNVLLLSHPTGNANVRAAASAFHRVGLLQGFHSCLCWNNRAPLAGLLPKALRVELERRSFPDLPLSLQHSHPWWEAPRLAAVKFDWQPLLCHEAGLLSIDRVIRSFDRSVAAALPRTPGLCAVYAYEDAALATFEVAQGLGLSRIYELPIGYWKSARQIFAEEAELLPQWASTLTGLRDSVAKLASKDAELNKADVVVVASQFVRHTLTSNQACSVPIHVLPYGAPPPTTQPLRGLGFGPLRVLFVGSLGQRRGLSYLLEAVAQLAGAVTLTLIGRPTSTSCAPLTAALERHKAIPSLPHGAILEQMRQHDVLVFPSLFEGFGLVLTEALSQGLPVIATPNTAAPDLIRDGVEGFIVPIRDSAAIAQRLAELDDDRDQLAAMRQACLRRAAAISWSSYQTALVDAVAPLLHH
ncbi:glycosyltransferase family 4 protein [Synechococcus sp. CS-1332]|uniref:glycosyltransferase family 4 protein n=1 Tax=Synechococcus sp. CS-1332 TaxID=2847972 RepID=UPI00223C0795|nr:glycosyltransferase family 4 protein [Synechococcus sp. CS-1332]MCT0208300.1 glycosyltransferase family 4 protein [Synechococcus sp. CS-1332]